MIPGLKSMTLISYRGTPSCYVPPRGGLAGPPRRGTGSVRPRRSPWSAAGAGRASGPASTPPGAGPPAGCPPPPQLCGPPSPSPEPPSYPERDAVVRIYGLKGTGSKPASHNLQEAILEQETLAQPLFKKQVYLRESLTLLFWALVARGCFSSAFSWSPSNPRLATTFTTSSTCPTNVKLQWMNFRIRNKSIMFKYWKGCFFSN